MTVWKLDPDWGTPRGPHGKTELHSRASRAAARHRYALTEGDAEAMNLHKCSFAPAVPLSVDGDAFTQLWEPLAYDWRNPWNGRTVRILDDRHAERIPDGTATLALALSPPDSSPVGAPPGTGTPTGAAAAAAAGTGTGAAMGPGTGPRGGTGTRTPTSRPDTERPRSLALTGIDTPTLLATGLAAVAAGVLALRTRTSGSDTNTIAG